MRDTFTWEKGEGKESDYIQISQVAPARPSGSRRRSSSSSSSSIKTKEYVSTVTVLASNRGLEFFFINGNCA